MFKKCIPKCENSYLYLVQKPFKYVSTCFIYEEHWRGTKAIVRMEIFFNFSLPHVPLYTPPPLLPREN